VSKVGSVGLKGGAPHSKCAGANPLNLWELYEGRHSVFQTQGQLTGVTRPGGPLQPPTPPRGDRKKEGGHCSFNSISGVPSFLEKPGRQIFSHKVSGTDQSPGETHENYFLRNRGALATEVLRICDPGDRTLPDGPDQEGLILP